MKILAPHRLVACVTGFVLLASLGTVPVFAADIPALMHQRRCDACHDAAKPLIGPPWTAIATRYRADRRHVLDALARKVVTGGGGAWGVVPMVPNEHVSADEARALVQWILDLPVP